MGTKLYVGNLSYDTTEEDLREAFEATGGTVTDTAIIMDRETGRPRGFGFVTMASPADVKSALKLDGTMLQGRTIRVNEAEERPRGGGGGGGRGRRDGGGGGGYGGGGGGGRRY